MLDGSDAKIDLYPGLAAWWRQAESVWEEHKGRNTLTLLGEINFRNKLTLQFPAAPHRVVYTKGGQYLAAARIDDQRVVIDHKLYWATASSLDEARYLTATLNSPALTKLVTPMMSRGEHNPRDFDKQVWRLPVPIYDPADNAHLELVKLAEQAEQIAAQVDVDGIKTFQAQRRLIRHELETLQIADAIDTVVMGLVVAP